MILQVSASSVLDFLGTVFGAAAAPPKEGGGEGAAGGPGEGACSGGYAVLGAAQLAAALDVKVEVLETLLTYLEVRIHPFLKLPQITHVSHSIVVGTGTGWLPGKCNLWNSTREGSGTAQRVGPQLKHALVPEATAIMTYRFVSMLCCSRRRTRSSSCACCPRWGSASRCPSTPPPARPWRASTPCCARCSAPPPSPGRALPCYADSVSVTELRVWPQQGPCESTAAGRPCPGP